MIENRKRYCVMFLQMFVTFHNFHRKIKKNRTNDCIISSIEEHFRKQSDVVAKTSKAILNENKIVHNWSCFIIFWYFLNCTSHSRSRHTNFSWPFSDPHSTSFLSNFSENEFTSREMSLLFHVNVDFFHTHQFRAANELST